MSKASEVKLHERLANCERSLKGMEGTVLTLRAENDRLRTALSETKESLQKAAGERDLFKRECDAKSLRLTFLEGYLSRIDDVEKDHSDMRTIPQAPIMDPTHRRPAWKEYDYPSAATNYDLYQRPFR